jgi:erythromycin esterase
MTKLLLTLLLSLGVCPMVVRAGVDGQWMIAVPGSATGILMEVKSDGGRIAGSLSGPYGKLEIVSGTMSADAISFETVIARDGQTIRVLYQGRVNGDVMELTARSQGFGGEQRFTATRRKSNAPPLDWFSEPRAPDEVITWLKGNAIPLTSVLPGSGFADMAPLKDRLKDARVVAMGEATHGTREFFKFKHRMLEFLVNELGFTVFGIEANWPESLNVNDYVLHGTGSAADAVAGLGFVAWQTQEVLELIRWMRRYNEDPAHSRKLKLYGFDMQSPALAESKVLGYIDRVDPRSGKFAQQTFAILGRSGENPAYTEGPGEAKQRVADNLATILRLFDERKQEYIAKSSPAEWAEARQHVTIIQQADVKMKSPGEAGHYFRDQAMAENVKWVLDREPAGTRMMLWAHNDHVAGYAPSGRPMGAHLRDIFGTRAALCGFVFNSGGFRALNATTGVSETFEVGPAPQGSLDATLAAVGMPIFATDLRDLTEGRTVAWFRGSHVSRQIGARYSESTASIYLKQIRAAKAFDLLVFVGTTTPSRPL